LDAAEARREARGLADVFHIIGQARYQDITNPDLTPAGPETAREAVDRRDIHARQVAMAFGIPGLEVQQHYIDLLEILVGEALAEIPVSVERRVDPHRLCRGEQLHDEAMLHQGLAAADGEPTGHDLQTTTVLAQFFGGPGNRHRDAVAHRPRIRVVTVKASHL